MICYQLPSRATWQALALQTGLASMVNGGFQPLNGHNIAIDEVGIVPITDAVLDASGNVVTPAVLASGYHVNLVHPDPPELLDQYLIIVNSPYRIFLGQDGPVPDGETLATITALI